MKDDRTGDEGIRPFSTSSTISRFPSLRRNRQGEAERQISLPRPSAPQNRVMPNPDAAYSFLYDDHAEYRMAQGNIPGMIGSGNNVNRSSTSFAPSFDTSNWQNGGSDREQRPDVLLDHALFTRGLLNSRDRLEAVPGYTAKSTEALAMSTIPDWDADKKKLAVSEPFEDEKHVGHVSLYGWYPCDDEQNGPTDTKEPIKIDIEAQKSSHGSESSSTEEKFNPSDGSEFIIKFEGPDDPMNPMNWPSSKKWAATACIAAFTFMAPLASTMVAPALPQISREFHITEAIETQVLLSIFVLAFAIGPMALGPLSELYGRVIVSQVSSMFFLVFNTACGFATNKQQLMAFRFLAGLGGSAPLALGGGVLGDIFKPEERGKAMGLYAMGPLIGPSIGPVVGGWVAEKSTWKWMFWATSIMNVIIQICAFIWFGESYAPYLLHQKAKKIRKETGNSEYRTLSEGLVDQPAWKKITTTMGRAFGMLFTQPIVQVMSLYMGFSFGILYLVLSTFPGLFMHQYGESVGISGLNYISLGLGFFVGAPIVGRSSDVVYQKLKSKDPHKCGKPEFRMPVIIPFTFFVPIGLLIYGWSAQAKTHWIVPNIGAFIFAMGTLAAFQCVSAYLVDTYAQFAASAMAAVTILRSLMGFAFPLFAPYMYAKLDYGWGNTVLGIAAFVIGVPTPLLLWVFGERLRKASSIARVAKPGGGPNRPGGPVNAAVADIKSKSAGADEKMKSPITEPPPACMAISKR